MSFNVKSIITTNRDEKSCLTRQSFAIVHSKCTQHAVKIKNCVQFCYFTNHNTINELNLIAVLGWSPQSRKKKETLIFVQKYKQQL